MDRVFWALVVSICHIYGPKCSGSVLWLFPYVIYMGLNVLVLCFGCSHMSYIWV